MAGSSMANVTVSWGWRGTFLVLAGVALLSSGAAAVYLRSQPGSRSAK
jgi:predicted MFS family arabinose efflux permease